MHDNQRHRLRAARLPMTVAQYLDALFHVEQALFGGRQLVAARQEISGEGLSVSAKERPPRAERLAEEIVRASCFRGAMRRRHSIRKVPRPCFASEVGIAMLHL